MSTIRTGVIVRPVGPEEHERLGDLTVAAYHSIPGEMAHQDAYDLQLRDVARRAATSCVLVAVTAGGELLGGVTYVSGPEAPIRRNCGTARRECACWPLTRRITAAVPGARS